MAAPMPSEVNGKLWKQVDLISSAVFEVKDIASALYEWGCCSRCTLRFLGEKQHFIYMNIEDINIWLKDMIGGCETERKVNKELTASANHTIENIPISQEAGTESTNLQGSCTVCLGILQQELCSSSFIDTIVTKSRDAGHQFNSFYCSLMLPVPILLREHAIWIMLKEKFFDVYDEKNFDVVPQIKEIWKWVNGRPLGEKLGVPFDQRSPYEIAINFIHPMTEKECYFLRDLYPEKFRQRKIHKGQEEFTRMSVAKALEKTPPAKFKQNYQCPPRRLSCDCEYNAIQCSHEALFMAGRYNKYSRTLSQTPWIVDGHRKTESSIQEQICDILVTRTKAAEHKFSSSGREDVDVKMLGNGRPFVVEFVNPKRVNFTRKELDDIQMEINNAHKEIRMRDLQVVTRQETANLKEGEIDKVKCYSALCCSEREVKQEELDGLAKYKDLVLKQKTPIRVLHRRPLAVRERTIHKLSAQQVDEKHFMLYLETQAGTYIKEFVHGDFGRTTPSLGEILSVDCDILELDVECVKLDWPPVVEET